MTITSSGHSFARTRTTVPTMASTSKLDDGSGTATISKRLHVSGLQADRCSVDDIKARFSSFGLQVSNDVYNWPPAPNAVGEGTNWCFVNVSGTGAQVQRAMTLLNGTMWKGSKLRIGYAKQRPFKLPGEEEGAGSAGAKVDAEGSKKKKRKRRAAGVESDDIDSPVTVEQVETGEWGWKKTAGGHLVRPLHMRPDHPIPTPAPIQEKERDGKRKKHRSQTGKSLVRAKRVTIDPLRYNAIHLSGGILAQANAEAYPPGYEWTCVEDSSEDQATVVWVLRDADGNVIKEEAVPRVKMPDASDEQQFTTAYEEEDSDDSDAFDEVDAAIDRAFEMSDDDSESAYGQASENPQTNTDDALFQSPHEDEDEVKEISFPHYDPDDEDAFSEGYQEVTGAESTPAKIDQASEKSGQLDLLRQMFGAKGVEKEDIRESTLNDVPIVPDDSESDDADDKEEDSPSANQEQDVQQDKEETPLRKAEPEVQAASAVTDGIARRAALLKALQPTSTSKQTQFQPIVRFDPATTGDAKDDVDMQSNEADDNEGNAAQSDEIPSSTNIDKIPSADRPREADRIEMHTLTDMFRPKEDKGGFSLLADLDLDLDDELNFEPDMDDNDVLHYDGEARQDAYDGYRNVDENRASGLPPAEGKSIFPFLFPRFNENRELEIDVENGRDLASLLARQVRDNEAVAQFFQRDDAETLARKWEERKATLTQEFKRRHREALKKKKRKVTGSRAAGTMPSR